MLASLYDVKLTRWVAVSRQNLQRTALVLHEE